MLADQTRTERRSAGRAALGVAWLRVSPGGQVWAVPSNGCTNPGAMIFLWRVHGLVAARFSLLSGSVTCRELCIGRVRYAARDWWRRS